MSHYRMFTKNQIKDIAEKASEGKANFIETNDIISVLDNRKVGDIIKTNGNLVCIISYVNYEDYPHSISMFAIDGDNDTIEYKTFLKDSGEDWIQDLNLEYINRETFEREKGTELYKHAVTCVDAQANYDLQIIFVSNSSTKFSFLNNFTSENWVSLYEILRNGITIYPYFVSYNASNHKLDINGFDEDNEQIHQSSDTINQEIEITDIVTPL